LSGRAGARGRAVGTSCRAREALPQLAGNDVDPCRRGGRLACEAGRTSPGPASAIWMLPVAWCAASGAHPRMARLGQVGAWIGYPAGRPPRTTAWLAPATPAALRLSYFRRLYGDGLPSRSWSSISRSTARRRRERRLCVDRLGHQRDGLADAAAGALGRRSARRFASRGGSGDQLPRVSAPGRPRGRRGVRDRLLVARRSDPGRRALPGVGRGLRVASGQAA